MAGQSAKKVGRPRASNRPVGESARDDILLVAARLFGENGFAGTSTKRIAEEVGIRQPSLFTHFKKKEDILRELVERSTGNLQVNIDRFRQMPGTGAQRLYALMRFDFLWLLREPYGVGALMQLPEIRQGTFSKQAMSVRQNLIKLYRDMIEQGVGDGAFNVDDPAVAAHTLFGMGEALWSWARPRTGLSQELVAEQVTDLAMRAILAESTSLQLIKSNYVAEDSPAPGILSASTHSGDN